MCSPGESKNALRVVGGAWGAELRTSVSREIYTRSSCTPNKKNPTKICGRNSGTVLRHGLVFLWRYIMTRRGRGAGEQYNTYCTRGYRLTFDSGMAMPWPWRGCGGADAGGHGSRVTNFKTSFCIFVLEVVPRQLRVGSFLTMCTVKYYWYFCRKNGKCCTIKYYVRKIQNP